MWPHCLKGEAPPRLGCSSWGNHSELTRVRKIDALTANP